MGSGIRAGIAARDRAPDGLDQLRGHEVAGQTALRFKEEAIAYATRNGIAYRVEEPKAPTRKIVSYSDNFRHNRVGAWTH